MSKFKLGDVVKRIGSPNGDIRIGDIFTVEKFDTGAYDSWPIFKYVSNDPKYLELVSSKDTLESLVAKANEGFSALKKIKDQYHNQHELINIYGGKTKIQTISDYMVQIKQNSRKFRVASWEAEINGEEVKIGCKTFQKGMLKSALRAVLSGTYNSFTCGPELLYAYRDGVQFYEFPKVTWQQAEDLLKELENS